MEGGIHPLKECYSYISYEAGQHTPFEAAQILDQAIKAYSPGSDSEKDILEEFRVRKGLIYLFSGDTGEAHKVFEEIVNNPLKQDGIWVPLVKHFLKIYHEPSDLYRACSALTACDPNRVNMIEDPLNRNCAVINPCQTEALDYVMSNQSTMQPLEKFTESLRTAGIVITSEDWIDLDNDGRNELWFAITPPTHFYYDLWIVSGYPNGIKTFNLGAFPNTTPKLEPQAIKSDRFLIAMGQLSRFIWARDPITSEPSLTHLSEWQDPNDTTDYVAINADLKAFEKIQSQLYVSENPATMYEKLLKIANRYDACPYELATPYYKGIEIECGDYYYTIGFAAELASDNGTAQKMYTVVLEQYPTHPIAFLAQKKLTQ